MCEVSHSFTENSSVDLHVIDSVLNCGDGTGVCDVDGNGDSDCDGFGVRSGFSLGVIVGDGDSERRSG